MADEVKMTPLADIRSVQLNEKMSETTYQILHPETDAYQVITDPERRFVSDDEKEKWNQAFALGASALHYRGEYERGAYYYKYDVVYLKGNNDDYNTGNEAVYPVTDTNTNGRRFFVYMNPLPEADSGTGNGIEATIANAPSYDQFTSNHWININFESYLAEFANNVRVTTDPEDTAYTFAICEAGSDDYRTLATTSSFYINPIRKTLEFKDASNNTTIKLEGADGIVTANTFKGYLDGTAKEALFAEEAAKYTVYNRDADKNLVDGERVEIGEAYIDDAIAGLGQRIDAITDGSGNAVLSNKLIIKKNGGILNDPGFDGSIEQVVNIEFTPEEITGLLDSSDKIQERWLPDTLLGAMSYVGTFDASTGLMTTDLRDFVVDENGNQTTKHRDFRKGDYVIATVPGNLDPSGKVHDIDTERPEATYFIVGDWAVFNGDLDNSETIEASEWTKIDNTDAVRTVNGQIGNVKTYKGGWEPNTPYYEGDMVEFGTPAAIYVCIKDNSAAEFTETNFKICGRIYDADDGIELTKSDNKFRHVFKNAMSTTEGSEDHPVELTQQGIIAIDTVTRQDKYGHINKVKTTYYKLPEDTWRPVKVNGEDFKDSDINSGPLDLTYDYRATSGADRDPRVIVSKSGDKVIVSHVDAKGGDGSHTSEVLTTPVTGQIKIGLGSQFTAPNFAWNASGHVDSYSRAVYELPTDLIQHQHFNVKLTDGRSMIRSFTNDEFHALPEGDKARKFYDRHPETKTFITPAWAEPMAFSGELMANGFYQLVKNYEEGDSTELHRVIDESIEVYSGKKFNGTPITGGYDDKRLVLGQSGVHAEENSVVYSAVAVNKYGITTAGAQILEFGKGEYIVDEVSGERVWISKDPSTSLVIGGLFFRNIGPKRDNNGVSENNGTV